MGRWLRKILSSSWWSGSWVVIYALIDAASWIGFPSLESEHSRVVWLLSVSAIFLIAVVAASVSLQQEIGELKQRLAEIPRLKIVPNSFKGDDRFLAAPGGIQTPIRSLVVQFRNQPEFHSETANAKDVIAEASFYNIDDGTRKFLFVDYPRWATNDNPKIEELNKHYVPTDIKIGGMAELDLAVKYLNESEAYAVTHQSYPNSLRHPKPLQGRKFLIVVTLSAVNIKECFEFIFENLGQGQPLAAISTQQVQSVG
jgi:hypothetical protein